MHCGKRGHLAFASSVKTSQVDRQGASQRHVRAKGKGKGRGKAGKGKERHGKGPLRELDAHEQGDPDHVYDEYTDDYVDYYQDDG